MNTPRTMGLLLALVMVVSALLVTTPAIPGAEEQSGNVTSQTEEPASDLTPDGTGSPTRDGRGQTSTFVADFQTTRGTPYQFDIIISNGSWMRKWNDVTSVNTTVPVDATYTFSYMWKGGEMIYRLVNLFERGGMVKDFDFYTLDPEDIFVDNVRVKPFILFQEKGANADLDWSWNPRTLTLSWEFTAAPGKMVGVDVGIDGDIFTAPNYAVASVKDGDGGDWATKAADGVELNEYHWSGDEYPNAPPDCHCGISITVTATASLADPIVGGSIDFGQSGTGSEPVGFGGLLLEHAILEEFEYSIFDDGGKLEKPGYVFPAFSLSAGNYQNVIGWEDSMGTDVELTLPLTVTQNGGALIEYRPEFPPVGSREWQTMMSRGDLFGVVASNPFARPTHSNINHDRLNGEITVDVNTVREYDWWGYFVLGEGKVPDQVMASYGDGTSEKVSLLGHGMTLNRVGDLNVVVVKIDSEVTGLRMSYTAAADKLTDIITYLEDSKIGDGKLDKKLDKAIDHIEKALDEKNWDEDDKLDEKKGKKAFDELKKAIKELEKIIKDKKASEDLKGASTAAIGGLTETALMLARDAYLDAQAGAGDKKVDKELEKCGKELVKADKEIEKENYDKAVDHCKKAWEHAQKAMK